MLDLICCVPALLVLLRRALDRKYIIRLTPAQASLGIFALVAIASTSWAANKSQALTLSFHVLAAAMIFWAMAQVVRSWGRLRIVAGVCMGLLMIYCIHGLIYRFFDLPDTLNFWKQHRTEEMQAHGWHEGDYELTQYELKLTNGEMVGFQGSPNTLAAAMVLMSVIVAGVGIQRIVNKDESGMVGATFLSLPVAAWVIWYTHSNAAFVSPVIAGLMLLGIGKFGGLLRRKRRMAFAAGVGAVLLGTAALVGHGIYHGTLPSASLNFRWRYWVASVRMFTAHPLLGVGYGNFGDAYLHYRVPAAAEEPKDPHNLLVRAATELGIVGAAAMLAWLVTAWWEWTRPAVPPAPVPSARTGHGTQAHGAYHRVDHGRRHRDQACGRH